MGGHLGGEIASRLAVDTVDEVIRDIIDDPELTLQADFEIRPGDYKGYLRYAIGVASIRVFEKALHDPTLHGMGTTIVAAAFKDDLVYLANVGDSRCYIVRDGQIMQLTEDHSLVSEQLKAGIIKPSEAKNHKLKNIITRSVGFQDTVDIDISCFEVKRGDKILLCTDGLTNMVSNEELLSVMNDNAPREACGALIQLANAQGGEDNITLIITEVLSVEKHPLADEETEGI
jgi:protein phosphatase